MKIFVKNGLPIIYHMWKFVKGTIFWWYDDTGNICSQNKYDSYLTKILFIWNIQIIVVFVTNADRIPSFVEHDTYVSLGEHSCRN